MPEYSNAKQKPDDWYFETSATRSRQWPLRSLKRADTLNCGIALAGSIMHSSNPVHAWIDFRRWIPDATHGSEIITDPCIQVFATRHGFALGFNWEYLLLPEGAQQSQPVLIYRQDDDFIFCDQNHFWKKSKLARYALPLFSAKGDQPPPMAGARWASHQEYMNLFTLAENEAGSAIPPECSN